MYYYRVMTAELQNYLIKKFPKLYTDVKEPTPFKMFGFECGDGWFRLILWLNRYLQDYIDQQNECAKKYPDKYLPVKQVRVVQIKEKFATLRFYVDGGNERTDAIISFVEYISGFVCESTGKIDNIAVNKKGWLKTQHVDNTKNPKYYNFVDDSDLRNILSSTVKENPNQLYLNL